MCENVATLLSERDFDGDKKKKGRAHAQIKEGMRARRYGIHTIRSSYTRMKEFKPQLQKSPLKDLSE